MDTGTIVPLNATEVVPDLEDILENVENLEHVVKNGTIRSNGLCSVQRRPSLKDSIRSIIRTTQAKRSSLEDGGLFLGVTMSSYRN